MAKISVIAGLKYQDFLSLHNYCRCLPMLISFRLVFLLSILLRVADEAVCGPQLTEHWCNWVTCQWKSGKHLREICFVKKRRESLNSFCLRLVPLANRYPDNKVGLLCMQGLVIWRGPAVFCWISYLAFACTDWNSSLLWDPFLISYQAERISLSLSMVLYFCFSLDYSLLSVLVSFLF